MKVILKYDHDDYADLESAEEILNARKNKIIVDSLYDVLIRPYYKHSYNDDRVDNILDKLGDDGEYLIQFFKNKINDLKGE